MHPAQNQPDYLRSRSGCHKICGSDFDVSTHQALPGAPLASKPRRSRAAWKLQSPPRRVQFVLCCQGLGEALPGETDHTHDACTKQGEAGRLRSGGNGRRGHGIRSDGEGECFLVLGL